MWINATRIKTDNDEKRPPAGAVFHGRGLGEGGQNCYKAEMSEKNARPKTSTKPADKRDPLICDNRRARFNYELMDFYDGGLVLTGSEVKSLRSGHAQINEAYASFSRGELWLIGAHIAHYRNAGTSEFNGQHEERRSRKILLHDSELKKIRKELEQKGLTLVPLRLFWQRGRCKVALAVARGKNTVDKRDTIKKRDEERSLRRIFKGGR